ncbi:MAG: glycoside hydrolase family 5 protein, partial [Lachnospiraceae bacterium]|nr:glycoside hydrolase family 5 protein [Lachnospiraceae bacterium]
MSRNRKLRKRVIAFVMAFAMVLSLGGVDFSSGEKKAKAAEGDYDLYETQTDAYLAAADYRIYEYSAASLAAVGVDVDACRGQSTVTGYAKVTKAHSYSMIRFSSGGTVKGTSNKALIGLKHASADNASYPNYVIHAGYGTEDEGTGKGEAGSGIYAFPNANTSKASDTSDGNELIIRFAIRTKDTEARLLGVDFGNGEGFTVNDDGTLTNGFNKSLYTLESTTVDSTDSDGSASDEETDDLTLTKEGLKNAIDYCKSLKAEDYTAESYAELQAAIPVAEAAYAVEDDTRINYKTARDKLEKERSQLVPATIATDGNPKAFRILSKSEVTKEMGAGINLGNTMEGNSALTPSETSWQSFKTTKEYIKSLHDMGYNTVRIPVTWGTMIKDDYSISEVWMRRVQAIVNYCTDQDMYAIINIHHDGIANHDYRGDNPNAWLNTYEQDIEKVYQKYEGVWKTIANRFKDYDEHLIFESMNEVTDAHKGSDNEDDAVLLALNQIFINTVRATGSNNTKRWLSITGRFSTTNGITEMPEDKLVDSSAETTRLMFNVHIYKGSYNTRWSYSDSSSGLESFLSSFNSTRSRVEKLDKNMPIYIGEYGNSLQTQDGSETGYNNVERGLFNEYVSMLCAYYGAVPVLWDQGGSASDYKSADKGTPVTGTFFYMNRPSSKAVFKDTIDGAMRGTFLDYTSLVGTNTLRSLLDYVYMSYGHETTSDNGVSTNPEINEITETTIEDQVKVNVGEYESVDYTITPEDTNDVLLWSTDDDSIATVFNGKIHGKKIG